MFAGDDNDYLLCPERFRLNCASYEVKCHECAACSGYSVDQFHYLPISKETELAKKNHPFLADQKKAKKDAAKKLKANNKINPAFKVKSKQVKDALKSEKKLLKSMGAKATIGSGRINNDGDGYLEWNSIKYYIEIKTRYSDNASMFPSSSEWAKAIEQGASLFMVESTKGNTVTMSKETFMEILGL